jgi:hypothetical protein
LAVLTGELREVEYNGLLTEVVGLVGNLFKRANGVPCGEKY